MTIGTNGSKPSARARRSATRYDSVPYREGRGGRFILSGGYGVGIPQTLPKYLPGAPKSRDRVLYTTPRAEAQWGSALGIAVTKIAAWSWHIASSTAARKKRLQALFLMADYGHPSGVWGYIPFMQRLGRDFLTTNNGCFFQVARTSRSFGSAITGLYHLSSLRCKRTGDPDYPVIYTDRMGHEQVLRWFDVVSLVDCPEPNDTGYGYGFCSADRAYDQIKILSAYEGYLYEKLTANSPTALHLINGLTRDQLKDVLADAEDEQAEDGLVQFMGAIIATMLRPDQVPATATIQLAGLPDNVTSDEVRARADLIYANALGMDLNEIRPQGGQALGVGASAQVMHQKAKGKGIISFRQQFEHGANWEILDPRSRFFFTERDLVDEERRARIAATYGNAVEKMVKSGLMSPRQGQEWLIDVDMIPRRFAHRDIVGDDLADDDKPALLDLQDEAMASGDKPVDTFTDPTGSREPSSPTPGPAGQDVPTMPRQQIADQTHALRTNNTEEPARPSRA